MKFHNYRHTIDIIEETSNAGSIRGRERTGDVPGYMYADASLFFSIRIFFIPQLCMQNQSSAQASCFTFTYVQIKVYVGKHYSRRKA